MTALSSGAWMQETIELRRVLPETDHPPTTRVGPRARYFYFFMALLIASVVVFGFGQTVGPRFLHTPYRKPFVLTVHAAVFSAWILFYLLQSGLVRAGNIRVHRLLGLVGAAFAVAIAAIGTITAVVMRRFDLQHPDLAVGAPTLRTALLDLGTFAIPFTLAIYWRNKPEFHRRLILIAFSGLTAAAFVRFPPVFHPWPYYYVGVDLLIFTGVLRDLVLDRRIHVVYLYAVPVVVLAQLIIMDTFQHFWVP